MCFSAKFRSLLDHRMLHTIICFGLQATHNLLNLIQICRPEPHSFMDTALGCPLELLILTSKTRPLPWCTFIPAGMPSVDVPSGGTALDAATLHRLPNHWLCMVVPLRVMSSQPTFRYVAITYYAIPYYLIIPPRIRESNSLNLLGKQICNHYIYAEYDKALECTFFLTCPYLFGAGTLSELYPMRESNSLLLPEKQWSYQ